MDNTLSLATMFDVGPNGKLPTFGSKYAACFDIYAAEDTTLKAASPTLVSTDLRLSAMANDLTDYYLAILPRSGNSVKGLRILNSPGTVDADYTGELKIIMSYNSGEYSHNVHLISKGDRIAQGMFIKLSDLQLSLRDKEENVKERVGGFGSTGA